MANEPVLLDSDALIGWLVATDAHHARAVQLFEALKRERMQPVVTNLVIGETATLLSRRVSQSVACQFLETAQALKTVAINEQMHHDILTLFAQQEHNGTSYVDMANIVVLRTLHISRLFAFDKVYSKHFNLPMWTL